MTSDKLARLLLRTGRNKVTVRNWERRKEGERAIGPGPRYGVEDTVVIHHQPLGLRHKQTKKKWPVSFGSEKTKEGKSVSHLRNELSCIGPLSRPDRRFGCTCVPSTG